MSSDIVIRAEGIGKKYLIGHKTAQRDNTMRDTLMRSLAGMGRSFADLARGKPIISGDEIEEFWALKDLDFEIRAGEVVGVIGANGAGKSTLLKVLSRITELSEGRLTIKGRVASLLEVGTGFHPELTGRENIYLNGAILGMTHKEIKSKFDEIVDFAGVEKFVDTPVKRYSSGMYVRLAFSVAGHLEPEILIVDEVLAVGDVEFQRKCLGRMETLSKGGRTILFVSHNLNSISNLCSRALVLDQGHCVNDGAVPDGIETFLSLLTRDQSALNERSMELRSGPIERVAVKIAGTSEVRGDLETGMPAEFQVTASAREDIPGAACRIILYSMDGAEIFRSASRPYWSVPWSLSRMPATATLQMPNLPLTPGEYLLGIMLEVPYERTLFEDSRFCKIVVKPPVSSAVELPNFFPASPLWPEHKWTI